MKYENYRIITAKEKCILYVSLHFTFMEKIFSLRSNVVVKGRSSVTILK